MTAIALTIAGSDSSGGAGIQADLKTFSALGVYGASVITALTAQNTLGVGAVAEGLKAFAHIPVVLDPVIIAASGDVLLGEQAIATLRNLLLPRATLITPNLPEAAWLLASAEAKDERDMADQACGLRGIGAQA